MCVDPQPLQCCLAQAADEHQTAPAAHAHGAGDPQERRAGRPGRAAAPGLLHVSRVGRGGAGWGGAAHDGAGWGGAGQVVMGLGRAGGAGQGGLLHQGFFYVNRAWQGWAGQSGVEQGAWHRAPWGRLGWSRVSQFKE